MWFISFLKKWFERILIWLGVRNKKAVVLFAGLDNSGKASLQSRLKYSVFRGNEYLNQNENEFKMGKVTFIVSNDYQGDSIYLKLGSNRNLEGIDAIIFLIDVSDQSRYDESRNLLKLLLNSSSLAKIPFLIFGNKCDKVSDIDDDSLRNDILMMSSHKANKPGCRYTYCSLCSVKNKIGYLNGLQWLSNYILMAPNKQ